MEHIPTDILRAAYRKGLFPMAESAASNDIFWMSPIERGVLPLGGFHISRSLRRRLRRATITVTLNADFKGVMAACADRPETWINPSLCAAYIALHREGDAHSLEIMEDGELIGGVYGVAQGAAFFAESMFSRRPDGSKMALAYLIDHLAECGYMLVDTQYLTPHLASLGGVSIGRIAYLQALAAALSRQAVFGSVALPGPQELIQRNTQRSSRA